VHEEQFAPRLVHHRLSFWATPGSETIDVEWVTHYSPLSSALASRANDDDDLVFQFLASPTYLVKHALENRAWS